MEVSRKEGNSRDDEDELEAEDSKDDPDKKP